VSLLLPPAAPTGLAATATSASSVSLLWVDVASTEANYKVEWSADGITWNLASSALAANTTSYTVTGLPAANTTYQFRVSAVNAAGPSGFATGSFTTDASAATALSFTPQQTQIVLSWTNANPGTTTEAVTRAPGTTAVTPVTAHAVTATGLTQGTSYTFTVSITGANGKVVAAAGTASTTGGVATVPTTVVDYFNRGNANTLGNGWRQFVVPIFNTAALRVNTSQVLASVAGVAYWNTALGTTQSAGFTFANGTVNNDGLLLKASGGYVAGVYQNAIRVQYNNGNVTVATTTNYGGTYTPRGTVSTGGNLANGNSLLATVNSNGLVTIWKTVGGNTTQLGTVQIPASVAFATGNGRVGLSLANGSRVDIFIAQ
jgi:hypothetical protein